MPAVFSGTFQRTSVLDPLAAGIISVKCHLEAFPADRDAVFVDCVVSFRVCIIGEHAFASSVEINDRDDISVIEKEFTHFSGIAG